jgi:protein SCO1/2
VTAAALFALFPLLALAGCGSSATEGSAAVAGGQQAGDHGYHGAYLEAPYTVPDLPLTDTAGKPYSVATAAAPLKVVFFGYTHCPDICQVVMSTIASAVTRIDAAQRKQVQVVFVTTDPARDTAPVLREYLDHFDPSFVGLTGSLPRVVDLAKPLKVYVAKGQKLPSGGYEVDHSTVVFGVTGNRAQVAWGQNTSPADMSADIIRLLTS